MEFDFDRSENRRLFERATACIPGGVYGHTAPAAGVPGLAPYFADRGRGCRYLDVDGREFIDFMGGYGPLILGFHHPEVEEAAARQRSRGVCFNHPAPVMVELAELLKSRVQGADWTVLAKNGSDVTTWCLQVAREATGRRKILKVHGAYHGVDAWCTPGHGGLIEEDRAHIHNFRWNDFEDFDRVVKEYADDIAAVFVTPYHHPVFAGSEMPAPGFHRWIRQTCDRLGALLILDDIRVGFRLHSGGSHRVFDIEPDLFCFCKAMGNGYPIAAALGRDAWRGAASRVFLTGSYWNNAEAMAAALTCLEILERDDVPGRIEAVGERWANGLEKLGQRHGLPLRLTGPRSAPYPVFDEDSSLLKVQAFCRSALRRGLFLHPHHNWFLGAAHDASDIDEALMRADEALKEVVDQSWEVEASSNHGSPQEISQ